MQNNTKKTIPNNAAIAPAPGLCPRKRCSTQLCGAQSSVPEDLGGASADV